MVAFSLARQFLQGEFCAVPCYRPVLCDEAGFVKGLCQSRRGYKRYCRLHCWLLQQHQAALKTGQLVTQRFRA